MSEVLDLEEERYKLERIKWELDLKKRRAERDRLFEELDISYFACIRESGLDATIDKELYVPQFSPISTEGHPHVANYNDYQFKVNNNLVRNCYKVSCALYLKDPDFFTDRETVREGLENRLLKEEYSYDLKTKEKVLVFYSKEK